MNVFTKIKQLDPMPAIALTLAFAIGLIAGQQTVEDEAVATSNPYKALTLSECTTDWECETAQLIADNLAGKLIHIDDPIFFPDSIPVVEPIDCEPKDKECLKQNANAGKPAHYPSICEPYISSNEHKEKTL